MTRLASISRCVALGVPALMVCLLGAGLAAGGDESQPAKPTVHEGEKVEASEYPWGWIRWVMNAQIDPAAEMTLGVVYIKPHQENPLHQHPNSAEFLHVLEGSCEHLVGREWVKLKTGDTVRIPQGVPHRARTGDEACRAVIVYNTGTRQMVEVKAENK